MLSKNQKYTIVLSIFTVALLFSGLVISILNLPPPIEDFTVFVSPIQSEVQRGDVIQTTITVKEANHYPYDVSLDASGQPSGVSVTFDPQIGKPTSAFSSQLVITVSPNASITSSVITIKATGAEEGKEHSCNYTLVVKAESSTDSSMSVTSLFYPSGWMGDSGDINLDTASTVDPYSQPSCIKITYSAASSQGHEWAGIYWQYPTNNWGDKTGGRNLTGVIRLVFWARGELGGEKAEFKVGGISGQYSDSIQDAVSIDPTIVLLSTQWQKFTIDLRGQDLSHVVGGFCWVTNTDQNPNGCTFYLDDIKYEKA